MLYNAYFELRNQSSWFSELASIQENKWSAKRQEGITGIVPCCAILVSGEQVPFGNRCVGGRVVHVVVDVLPADVVLP